MKTELDHNRYRIVGFCDLETRRELRLAANLRDLTNEEVSETYRHLSSSLENRASVEVLENASQAGQTNYKKPQRRYYADLHGMDRTSDT